MPDMGTVELSKPGPNGTLLRECWLVISPKQKMLNET